MSSRVKPILSRYLQEAFAEGLPGLLLTVDDEGYPHTAFTWAVAIAPDRLRFGADHGGTTLANLRREGAASVQVVLQEGQPHLVKGRTVVLSGPIAAAPFDMALVEMEIEQVRDQSWIGVSVTPMSYNWREEDRDRMLEVEQAVYAEMRDLGRS